MQPNRKRFHLVLRWTLAVVIVGAVASHFVQLLNRSELWDHPPSFDPLWVVGIVVGYVIGFMFWGGFWLMLLRTAQGYVPIRSAVRAYFISQLGKYVPGKALAIVLRVLIVRRAGVHSATAALTAVYETLTVMASGALLAAGLLPLVDAGSTHHLWKIVALLGVVSIPILPAVFNRLARHTAHRFAGKNDHSLAPLAPRHLLIGLAETSIGWMFLGLSLKMLLAAFGHDDLDWLSCTAYVSFAYVAGFLTLPAPGGLGVREALLQHFLASRLIESMGTIQAEGFAAVIALSLRFWWTVSEVGLAGLAFFSLRETRRE